MKYSLSDICSFRKTKVAVDTLSKYNYISTQNMLPNKGGIVESSSLPTVSFTQEYRKGDILVSNIRPYFKKIWQATFDGGCSNDVLVFVANGNVNKEFLYYALANDDFFKYAMATSKGTKMPRGDKKLLMQYEITQFEIDTQKKISNVLQSIDEKIKLNKEINNNLEQQLFLLYEDTISISDHSLETTLSTLCCFQEGYVNPSQTHPEYFDGEVKWLRAQLTLMNRLSLIRAGR